MPHKDPDKYREYHREYQRQRRVVDPEFRAKGNALSKAYQEKRRVDPLFLANKRSFQKNWYNTGDNAVSQSDYNRSRRQDPIIRDNMNDAKQRVRKTIPHDPVVYFIESCGKIKIGHTVKLNQRFQALQIGCPAPMVLLTTIPGGSREEFLLHRKFKDHRSHGEWFEKHQDILGFVQECIDAKSKA